MEAVCPRCKTTSYRNPNMKLMVNVCGHNLCESCVELLFVKGSGSCPECDIPLRRGNFRLQLFEDAIIDKEVDIRRRILKDFNKHEEDFDSLREYNDYLEMVEDIIYNLCNNIDILETNKKIIAYKEQNKDQIFKNRNRVSVASLELEDMLAEERQQRLKRAREQQTIEETEKAAKIRNKEKLIDDLMFGEEDADTILEQHREQLKKTSSSTVTFSSGQETGKSLRPPAMLQQKVPDEPFVYREPVLQFNGPVPPSFEELSDEGYIKNIRSATSTERAGGYVEAIGCLRALQEAMSGLYFRPPPTEEPEILVAD